MGLSFSHLLLLLVLVLILFGAGKLPQVMGDIAKGFKAFKDGMNEPNNTQEKPTNKQTTKKTEKIIDGEVVQPKTKTRK